MKVSTERNDNVSNVVNQKTSDRGARFLQMLWAGHEPEHYRFAAVKDEEFLQKARQDTGDVLDIVTKESNRGLDTYISVASYKEASYKGEDGKTKHRTQENVAALSSLFLDIDCGEAKAREGKGYRTQKEAMTSLGEFCRKCEIPAPNLAVSSGHGLHVYWSFGEPMTREQWEPRAKSLKTLTKANGLLADHCKTTDCATVLRPVGTVNHKEPDNLKPVKLLSCGEHLDLEDFTRRLEAASKRSAQTKSNVVPLQDEITKPETPALPPDALAAKVEIVAQKVAETRGQLWHGELDGAVGGALSAGVTKDYNDLSQADHALACEIVRQARKAGVPGGQIAEVVELVFSQSGLVRDKWTDRADYRERTIAGAIDAVDREQASTAAVQGDTLPNGKNADILNGELFAKIHRGKLLFVHETGDVLAFQPETGYVHAEPEADMRAAKAVIAHLQKHASAQLGQLNGEEPGKKLKRLLAHIDRSSTASKLRAMIDVARSEDGMTCRLTDLDANPMRLGLPNGVLDLQTRTLLPATPDLLVTQRCRVAFDPDTEALRFKQFLQEVIPNREIRKFLRVFFGHALIGRVEHQLFLFLYGLGANGKSVFIEIIRWVMGEYARKISTEMLMRGQRSPGGPSPDLMGLKGRRLAYANETEEGSRLAESRVKDLTGGDTISARELYGRQVNFEPSHSLVIVGNHRQEIHDDGLGMWRRVALVDFSVTIPEEQRDPRLLEQLKTEGPGILNWMLSGLCEYQRNGLVIPDAVKAATNVYRDEMDILGDWLSDACTLKAGETADKGTAYQSYRSWAMANGHGALSQAKLTRRLRNRDITVTRDKRQYTGLKVERRLFT